MQLKWSSQCHMLPLTPLVLLEQVLGPYPVCQISDGLSADAVIQHKWSDGATRQMKTRISLANSFVEGK